MKKKRIILLLSVLLLALPLRAVFKEDNLNQTLSVLLMELKETYAGLLRFSGSAEKRIQDQHQRLVELVDECNELSVMLYSQASENTFGSLTQYFSIYLIEGPPGSFFCQFYFLSL